MKAKRKTPALSLTPSFCFLFRAPETKWNQVRAPRKRAKGRLDTWFRGVSLELCFAFLSRAVRAFCRPPLCRGGRCRGLLSAWTNGGKRTARCVDFWGNTQGLDAIALRIYFTVSAFPPPSSSTTTTPPSLHSLIYTLCCISTSSKSNILG